MRRDEVRLVPVDVIGLTAWRPIGKTIALSALEGRAEVGADVTYVGALVDELRSRCRPTERSRAALFARSERIPVDPNTLSGLIRSRFRSI